MTGLFSAKFYKSSALKILPEDVNEYFNEGSGNEETLRNNEEGFKRYRIRPRYLRNVSNRSIHRQILGKNVSIPIGIAPTAMQKLAHPDGEIGTAQAAEELNTIFILSSYTTTELEQVAKAAPNCRKWLQTFLYRNRDVSRDLIDKAEKAGFEALVVTCDFPVMGLRLSMLRKPFQLPPHLRCAILSKYVDAGMIENIVTVTDESADWKYITWIKTITKLPIIAKGILTAEDAVLAVEAGASAIIVSNHGARQVDGLPATIEALPEIVKAVGDQVEVYIDGGIRDGTDVFKALALGAKMVFLGRPVIWGLANAGKQGVKNVLNLLKNELDTIMAISGCVNLDEISRDRTVHESYYSKM